MKNKKIITFLVVGVIVLLVGGFLVLSDKKAPAPIIQIPPEEIISMMKPEEIGLTLTASSDNKKVILEVENTNGITGLDYELSYTSKGNIPRGVIGHIDIKQAGRKILQEITLGTCSDVCHYDEGVSNIKLILKVAKTDGTVGQVEKSLEL
ncbi:MAG: hypothetical protein A3B47_00155 [Candidatus Levybacteria bacterium RIFCSPLOWO2_01_FULL_39_24]|nr:MAG: hypothetical protein A2800_01035 [Candidatus Levybacteria bacterium RIFCSPHIGHO2_01_FULL_40_16]OGH28325.1 MAG: hypothetical protein A3E12_01325 [Candidatus Levybacteria bacterium RIFCSPHIGHO2_12_FULL_39_9]OGH46189.1 MAG: hypothetical protein A3B47_00155 [Candidatus Levybacteria bacterium RIFCSPLOWO2_01_FULL_39_24]